VQTSQTRGATSDPAKEIPSPTFQGRKPSVQDQLQIAKVSLGERNRRKRLSFIIQLLAPRRIARNEVLEDSTCATVRLLALSVADTVGVNSLP
jgi:hypothetical protein